MHFKPCNYKGIVSSALKMYCNSCTERISTDVVRSALPSLVKSFFFLYECYAWQ